MNSSDLTPTSEIATVMKKVLQANDTSALKRLLDDGADPETRMVIDSPAGTTSPINFLLALRLKTRCLSAVRLLLEHGADVEGVDEHNQLTHLMMFASDRIPEGCKLLLEFGANVHARHRRTGTTALSYACGSGGHSPTIQLLLSHGAQIKPTHFARVDLKVAQLLVDRGADINACDAKGRTPLLDAASGGQLEMGKWLLEKGADINRCNIFGENALTLAVFCLQWSFAQMLMMKGACTQLAKEYLSARASYGLPPGARAFLDSGGRGEKPKIIRHVAPETISRISCLVCECPTIQRSGLVPSFWVCDGCERGLHKELYLCGNGGKHKTCIACANVFLWVQPSSEDWSLSFLQCAAGKIPESVNMCSSSDQVEKVAVALEKVRQNSMLSDLETNYELREILRGFWEYVGLDIEEDFVPRQLEEWVTYGGFPTYDGFPGKVVVTGPRGPSVISPTDILMTGRWLQMISKEMEEENQEGEVRSNNNEMSRRLELPWGLTETVLSWSTTEFTFFQQLAADVHHDVQGDLIPNHRILPLLLTVPPIIGGEREKIAQDAALPPGETLDSFLSTEALARAWREVLNRTRLTIGPNLYDTNWKQLEGNLDRLVNVTHGISESMLGRKAGQSSAGSNPCDDFLMTIVAVAIRLGGCARPVNGTMKLLLRVAKLGEDAEDQSNKIEPVLIDFLQDDPSEPLLLFPSKVPTTVEAEQELSVAYWQQADLLQRRAYDPAPVPPGTKRPHLQKLNSKLLRKAQLFYKMAAVIDPLNAIHLSNAASCVTAETLSASRQMAKNALRLDPANLKALQAAACISLMESKWREAKVGLMVLKLKAAEVDGECAEILNGMEQYCQGAS